MDAGSEGNQKPESLPFPASTSALNRPRQGVYTALALVFSGVLVMYSLLVFRPERFAQLQRKPLVAHRVKGTLMVLALFQKWDPGVPFLKKC